MFKAETQNSPGPWEAQTMNTTIDTHDQNEAQSGEPQQASVKCLVSISIFNHIQIS